MARPKKEIKKSLFEELCKLQATQEEICNCLDVTDKVLTNWCLDTYDKSFSEIFSVKRENGKLSLRRSQWKMSETVPSVAIFLGKNYLGQSDQRQHDLNVSFDIEEFRKAMTENYDVDEGK